VLKHVMDCCRFEDLAIIGYQGAQHLDVVRGCHEQAMAAKVALGDLVHVAAAQHGAAEGVGVVGIQINKALSQVLTRYRVEPRTLKRTGLQQ